MQQSIQTEIEIAFSSLENLMAPRSIVFAGKNKAEKQAMLSEISAEAKRNGFSCCTFDVMQDLASGDIWEQLLKIGKLPKATKLLFAFLSVSCNRYRKNAWANCSWPFTAAIS